MFYRYECGPNLRFQVKKKTCKKENFLNYLFKKKKIKISWFSSVDDTLAELYRYG